MDPTILVSKRGVAEQYGIPINTQEDLHRKGLFAPQLKVGGEIYYRRSELEAWLGVGRGACSIGNQSARRHSGATSRVVI